IYIVFKQGCLVALLTNSSHKDLSGFIVFTLKRIRQPVNIEILNYLSENRFDDNVEFYIDLLGKKLHEREINFLRAERIRKISQGYARFGIYYTPTSQQILEKLKTFNQEAPSDNGREYDYVFLWDSEDMVSDYKGFSLDLYKLQTGKVKLPNYCKIKKIKSYLEDYEPYGEVLVDRIWNKIA
ncbi:MAG: hypothetical protein AAF518_23190, partial [Spirochaetota bacterium]